MARSSPFPVPPDSSDVLRSELAGPAPEAARALLGAVVSLEGVSGRIVETEAYERFDDPASHSANGPTARNASMFGPPGTLYVYRIYGIHWCANVACGPEGHGAAVLIRALEPLEGTGLMATRRDRTDATALCSGPGKLCQALGIDGEHDGIDVLDEASTVRIVRPAPMQPETTLVGPRIGISRAVERPWRFGLADSPHLSRPFGR